MSFSIHKNTKLSVGRRRKGDFYVSCFDKMEWQGLGKGWEGVSWRLCLFPEAVHSKIKNSDNKATHKAFPRHNKLCSSERQQKTRRQQLNHLHLAHDSIEHSQLNTRLNIARYWTVDGHLQSQTSLTHGYLIEQRPQKPHNTVRETTSVSGHFILN